MAPLNTVLHKTAQCFEKLKRRAVRLKPWDTKEKDPIEHTYLNMGKDNSFLFAVYKY